MNQPQKYARQSRRLGLVHTNYQFSRLENKNQTDRISPICCEGIGNELHYLIECRNKAITKTRSEFLKPFYNR